MGRVTGIGGVFFKVEDPGRTRDWYREHLGLHTDEYGTSFEWLEADGGSEKGFTQWSPFQQRSDYFRGEFMINYRVEDLDSLLDSLRAKGVEILDEVQAYEYGRFVHIVDGDGVAVELWEPNNSTYDDMIGEGRTKSTYR